MLKNEWKCLVCAKEPENKYMSGICDSCQEKRLSCKHKMIFDRMSQTHGHMFICEKCNYVETDGNEE